RTPRPRMAGPTSAGSLGSRAAFRRAGRWPREGEPSAGARRRVRDRIRAGGAMSRELRTLCDIFTAAVETGKPDLLISKVAGSWQPISARDFGFTVRALSLGLNALGVQPGDRVAILAENRPQR